MKSKPERLAIFFARLKRKKRAPTALEALKCLSETLNEVENAHSGIPFNPAAWMSDGRIYPPQRDSERSVPGFPEVRRYRSRQHNTFIARHGAIEIQTLDGVVLFAKLGQNGKGVWAK